jgi:hypothetical protein
MRRVAILSNLDEQCGNAQYGRILKSHLAQWFDVVMLNDAQWMHAGKPDVVIINWHPARVSTSVAHVKSLQNAGAKVILILQNSYHDAIDVPECDILFAIDAVVAHEPITLRINGVLSSKMVFIPHGILEVPNLHNWNGSTVPMFGTAGFQFPWKRTDVVVSAAARCGVQARIFCPPYPGFDRNREIDKWHMMYKNVHVDRNWLSEGQVIQCLSEHVLNIFWFESQGMDDQWGQSGAVRLGIAAKRPTIISKHRKFRTLMPYQDELYVAESPEEVYAAAQEIVSNPSLAKRPDRLMKDMGWSRCAELYKGLIESL